MQDRRPLESANDRGTLPRGCLLQEHTNLDIERIRHELFIAGGLAVDQCQTRRDFCNADGSALGHDEDFVEPVLLRENIGKDKDSQQRQDERPCDGHVIKSAY